jgi:hypothetical protein
MNNNELNAVHSYYEAIKHGDVDDQGSVYFLIRIL